MSIDLTIDTVLPDVFARWFESRGWAPRAHQLELLAKARAKKSALLIAPTGAGKTLAGFLPTLVELTSEPRRSAHALHTLYISPLKALAVDIARNLEQPVAEMGLPVRIETRTGDTPVSKRTRQRRYPPDILLTTPEQVALLLASADAPLLFGTLSRIVLDELHALVTSKRGDLLSLGLARLFRLAPRATTVGLSATVADPESLCRYLVPQPPGGTAAADLVVAEGGAAPVVHMLDSAGHVPWAGHSARHAFADIYALIRAHRTTLVFVNTRMQAEMVFQELWRINDDGLAIALHHGSLDVAQRRKVEDAMAVGRLRAVVCTSSLDLGIDWGDVDLVVNVGAPKGSSRLLQRIGRANHRFDEPSEAVLIPANRFEVLECRAGIEAVADGAQDTPPLRTGALDVLAQHILGSACAAPFDPNELYAEITHAALYADLTRADFDATVDFVATGGYALRAYERFAKIRAGADGRYRIANPRVAQQYRLNVGTIVEADMLKVRLVRSRAGGAGHSGPIARGGRILGQVEEYFIETLSPGNTFVFAGEVLRYEALVEDEVYVSRTTDGMLLTRRLERAKMRPLGFIANEYALAVWGLGDVGRAITHGELALDALFDEDMLGDDLEAWLAESALMKRTFRACSIIAGLIERRFPGKEKSRRQMTISTDLVYDVLRKHQPDHILLRAARADAATGLLDIRRLGQMLSRIRGRIVHKALDHVSPLAVPVMLEIGREQVYGEASDALLAEAEAELVKEAMQ